DLYYRLNVFPIQMPPLRERGEDVILLAEKFAELSAQKMGKQIHPLSPDNKRRLRYYSWPGNVRELQNIIERAVITAENGEIKLEDSLVQSDQAPSKIQETDSQHIMTVAEMELFEKQNILNALNRTDWKISGEQGAAKLLGVPPTTLSSRMKAL